MLPMPLTHNASKLARAALAATLVSTTGLAGALTAATLAPAVAHANPSAADILKKMDDEYNKFTDLEVLMHIEVKSGTTVEKTIEARTYQLGGTKRLVRMLSPGNIKGMSVLIEDKDNMYVYLPDMQRVRRVAAHNAKGSFLGTDFTEQEMSILRYGESFDPTLAEETADAWVLKLAPKPGREYDFASLKLWVDKKSNLFTKLEYYAADGSLLKTQTRGELKSINGVAIQSRIEMTDHQKKRSTVMAFSDLKVNQGLKENFFSRRNLEWGGKR